MADDWNAAREKVRDVLDQLARMRNDDPQTREIIRMVKDLATAVDSLGAISFTTTQNLIQRLAEMHNRLVTVEATTRK